MALQFSQFVLNLRRRLHPSLSTGTATPLLILFGSAKASADSDSGKSRFTIND
jgi:hypothetical protein